MTTRGWKALAVVGTFMVGGGLALPPSAEACAGSVCDPGQFRVSLPADAVVPANVPALVTLPSPRYGMEAEDLHLRTEDGADVEARYLPDPHHGSGLIVPAAPLVPGTRYRLEANNLCGNFPPGPVTSVTAFTAGPEVALPATSGTLRAAPEQFEPFLVWEGENCSDQVEGSTVTLSFTPAPELVPFLPWVRWTLEVDGKMWSRVPHGAVDATGTAMPPNRFASSRDLLIVYSVCRVLPDQYVSQDAGLPPGRHVATLRPVLEQSGTPLPPLEVAFELTCPKDAPAPGPDDSQREGCSQTGGGLAAFGLLATLRLWRRGKRP